MAYTPELSDRAACTLRRISWAINQPMTVAMESIFEQLPRLMDRKKVCFACRDRSRCNDCFFKPENRKEVMTRQQ